MLYFNQSSIATINSSKNFDYTTIYDVINSNSIMKTISSVLEMISEGKTGINNIISESTITDDEEMFFDIISEGEDIHRTDKIAIMVNNIRFIYCSSLKRFSNVYNRCCPSITFSLKSKINDQTNTFTTFFISNNCASDQNDTILLVANIIIYYINKFLEDNGFIMVSRDRFNSGMKDIYIEDRSIKDMKFMVYYYFSLFKMLNNLLDLTADDFDDIKDILFNDIDGEYYKDIYMAAIDNYVTTEDIATLIKRRIKNML